VHDVGALVFVAVAVMVVCALVTGVCVALVDQQRQLVAASARRLAQAAAARPAAHPGIPQKPIEPVGWGHAKHRGK